MVAAVLAIVESGGAAGQAVVEQEMAGIEHEASRTEKAPLLARLLSKYF
jgi:hypothetical protein